MNRCAARGRGRWTRAGEELCTRHTTEGVTEALESGSEPRQGLAAFRERLAAGDYNALLGPGLQGTLRGAAADSGLEAEIGALRLALARLLQEEDDPSRLASGIARVAGVSVQAARQRQSGHSNLDEFRAAVARVLAAAETELEGGDNGCAGQLEVNGDDTDGGSNPLQRAHERI